MKKHTMFFSATYLIAHWITKPTVNEWSIFTFMSYKAQSARLKSPRQVHQSVRLYSLCSQ